MAHPLWQGIIIGEKKLLKKILNKIGPAIEPCGTPDVIVWNLTVYVINFYTFLQFFLFSKYEYI